MRAELTGAWRGGRITAPPSKSMAHRALICAALAQGESRIENIAHSKDIDATAGALRAFGAQIDFQGNTALVQGTGGRLCTPGGPVWCCESGSTLRFLIPLGALCGAPVRFCGEGRLPQRPQTVYAQLFCEKGVAFSQNDTGVCVNGRLSAGRFCVDGGVSSQFISGLLFALPLLGGASTICVRPPFESRSYVQLTRSALAAFGVQAVWQDENTLFVEEKQKYTNCNYTVEGDASQAAFFGVLGAVRGGVQLAGLRPGSAQGDMAFLPLLRQAGAAIVCVTRFIKSPLTAYADLTLLCGANESPLQAGSSSAEISQLFLIDMLYTEYYRTYYDKCSVNNEKTSASVMAKLC